AAGRLPALSVLSRGELMVRAPSEEARQVGLLAALSARAPALLHLRDPTFAELRLAQRALGGVDGALLLVEHEEPIAGAETIRLPPLGEADVARLCEVELGRAPRAEFVREVMRAAGGLPLGIRELCAAAWPDGDAADVKALSGAGLRERARRQLAAHGQDARRLAVALALSGGPIAASQALAIADAPGEALARLCAEGTVVAAGAAVALATAAHVEAARALADRPLVERTLAAASDSADRARLLGMLGRTRDASAAHLE